MSELLNAHNGRKSRRWELLVTVSVLALPIAFFIEDADAEDAISEHPAVWIELGGQLDSLNDAQQAFSPPFMASVTQPSLLSALDVQRPPASSFDGEGKISFQPEESDWVLSASIRYGRSSANTHRHQQIANKTVPANFNLPPPYSGNHIGPKYYYPTSHIKFADGQARQTEAHNVIDFLAGKDVGLGMFGGRNSSILSAGVRIAQFTSKSNVSLHAEPDVHYPTAPIESLSEAEAFRSYHAHFHDYGAVAGAQRSFHGVGPSLAWSASVPFAGNSEHGEMSLDWGANGAVLFGRQRVSGQHKTAIHYYHKTGWQTEFGQNQAEKVGHFVNPTALHTCAGEQLATAFGPQSCKTNSASFNRARTVIVPNFGGTVGFSYRIEDFKVSLGYRADFFFGAMDGGIDSAKKENRGFFGPFATISIGIGG
jgi:hypothetical protein